MAQKKVFDLYLSISKCRNIETMLSEKSNTIAHFKMYEEIFDVFCTRFYTKSSQHRNTETEALHLFLTHSQSPLPKEEIYWSGCRNGTLGQFPQLPIQIPEKTGKINQNRAPFLIHYYCLFFLNERKLICKRNKFICLINN